MRNDDHLIFEGYKKKSSLHFGMSEGEYNDMEEKREKAEHKQFKKDYKKAVKSGDLKTKSEDAEDYDWNDREESDYDHGTRRHRGNGRYTDYRTGASHRDDQGPDDEDEETTCKYAKEGCDCDGCQDCKSNQTKSEDAETYGVEEKIKMALHEVEGIGYTGDHLDCKEIAKLVVGSPGDWGDSYGHVVQALEHVLTAYYEKGVQDS